MSQDIVKKDVFPLWEIHLIPPELNCINLCVQGYISFLIISLIKGCLIEK